MRQIVLDLETTGMRVEEGHKIIEIGCLELINRKLTGVKFHRYINPEREIDSAATAVHGITTEFLVDKPTFKMVAEELIDFIKGSELIIHNATFDVGFLNSELLSINRFWKGLAEYCKVIDTLPLARQLHVGQRNSLDALCKRYGVDNTKREVHGAMLDAYLLAQVYLAMTGGQGSFFDSINISDIGIHKKAQIIDTQLTNRRYNLVVLKANEQELTEHNNLLEKMQQQGKCLWLEDMYDA